MDVPAGYSANAATPGGRIKMKMKMKIRFTFSDKT